MVKTTRNCAKSWDIDRTDLEGMMPCWRCSSRRKTEM